MTDNKVTRAGVRYRKLAARAAPKWPRAKLHVAYPIAAGNTPSTPTARTAFPLATESDDIAAGYHGDKQSAPASSVNAALGKAP